MVSERVPSPSEPAISQTAAAPPKPSMVKAWVITLMLLASTLIAYLDKAILGLVAQPVMADLGLTATQFGTISTAASLLGPAVTLLFATVADRLPLKGTLFTLVLLWSLIQLPIFFAASAGMLVATRLLLGAADAPSNSVMHSMAYSWWPNERRGLPAALLTTGASFGKLIFAPVLVVVIAALGWQYGFLSVAIMGFVWCIGWAFVGKTGPYAEPVTPRPPKKAAATAGDDAPEDPTAGTKAPLRSILLTGTFIGYLALFSSVGMLVMIVLTWLPSYFEAGLGFSAVTAGSLFGVPSITSVIFLFAYGAWGDRALKRGVPARVVRTLIGGGLAIAGGLSLMALPLVDGVALPMALLMLGYGLSTSIYAIANPTLAQITPAAQRTGVLSLGLALSGLLGVPGPVLAGMVLDAAKASSGSPADGYTSAFLLAGVIVLIGGALFALLANPERDALKVEAARAARAARTS
ncbi:Hexuronate transporter [Nonomuraea coxensis DSM 45129]|uniref:Hexuronate transporter n=1 Tax=Nonomuraea coxensis DSM 45129 TaxID=1122611 RepID=A0ABX8U1K2_9ACTN|nr:MFS transporter [Nonomuraea coxensis]QYC41539.1 Hexuronate transporter [Nonomuraea coxensis DSM 45129]